MEMTNIQSAARNIVSVALADIQPSNYNPRKTFDEASLAELAESIRQQGVLQPIGVRPIEENRYEVIFGERRYRASLMAGLETIPAVMHEVTDEVAEEMAVTENLQRKDVTPIEEANAYQKLIESGRHDVKSLAVQFGLGCGRDNHQCGERNLPLRGGHTERGVRKASERQRLQQLAWHESRRCGKAHRAGLHDRPQSLFL